jgi:hypothetical protein
MTMATMNDALAGAPGKGRKFGRDLAGLAVISSALVPMPPALPRCTSASPIRC